MRSGTPEPTPAALQDPLLIDRVLRQARRIAIIGLSADPAKASRFVAAYLQAHGYEVIGINPRQRRIEDIVCYPNLAEVPGRVDIVDVFRPAAEAPGFAREAVAAGVGTLWLQLGLYSPEAADIARDGGIHAVMDRCVKIEHGRRSGGLHWAGINTGVIDARRRPMRLPTSVSATTHP